MAKTAVVVGATNGIGKAISCRLARDGFDVIAVGRDKPGRKEEVLQHLANCAADGNATASTHQFYPCDAFSLSQVKSTSQIICQEHKSIDALIMTQGMATIQSFTPTYEGNDEKLTLHYWSRAAFTTCLLPSLQQSTLPGGGVVLSILSGGVHSPYKKYDIDPELKSNYSIKNAADAAGYYNDLFLDRMAFKYENVNFIHAAPGFVASQWGTEMPWALKVPIRWMQRIGGKSTDVCAENMVKPILACVDGKMEMERPKNGKKEKGVYIMNEDGSAGKLSKGHTVEAMESVWKTTKDVLGRAGIVIQD